VEKMKKRGKAVVVVIMVLLASMTFTSVVGMKEHSIDAGKNYEVNKLSKCLEDAVIAYNEAVTEGRLKDAWGYVEKIDQIITELEALGMEVEFTMTSENQGMLPATVSASVRPATEQNRPRRRSISASEEQLEMINLLVGQNITIGEFMEKVFPEVLEDMPEEIAKNLYATEMIWPSSSEPLKGENQSQAVVTKAFKPASERTEVQPKFIILVIHASYMDPEWPNIDFGSWSRVVLPHPWYRLPYMAVSSSLWYEGNEIVDIEFEDGENAYKVEASGSYSAKKAGNYSVIGVHWGEYPPGYYPPAYLYTTQTDEVYVGP